MEVEPAGSEFGKRAELCVLLNKDYPVVERAEVRLELAGIGQ